MLIKRTVSLTHDWILFYLFKWFFKNLKLVLKGLYLSECIRIFDLWCSYRNVYSRIVYTRYVSAFIQRRPRKKNSRDSIFFFSLSWFRFPLSFVAMLFVSELTPRNVFIDRLLLFFSSIVSHTFTLPFEGEIFAKRHATCMSKSCVQVYNVEGIYEACG